MVETNGLAGKTVLITGGTGSFGTTMLRDLLGKDVGQVRIFSRDEEKQDRLRNEIFDRRTRYYIGDVRDERGIDMAMRGVDFVFHAAALKQVPSCEFFPMEAMRTNVEGSNNVIESAIRNGVKSVVCLSTDKAVYPVNAMGMSKALMEKVAQAAARKLGEDAPRIACVRYGNVLYSRGSVVPLFIRQLREGRPLTVTNPEMTRFLMPLSQSVDLVDYAMVHARQGDVFIRKAVSARMHDLVEAVKRLFGKTNAPVKVIGSRHGEKLFETLASADEMSRAVDMGEYMRLPLDARDLNYSVFFSEGDTRIDERDELNSHNVQLLNIDQICALLETLPEVKAELERPI
jgi:UDP-N-acetylglucosamine 4,6-dehydratase/5-epimerase